MNRLVSSISALSAIMDIKMIENASNFKSKQHDRDIQLKTGNQLSPCLAPSKPLIKQTNCDRLPTELVDDP